MPATLPRISTYRNASTRTIERCPRRMLVIWRSVKLAVTNTASSGVMVSTSVPGDSHRFFVHLADTERAVDRRDDAGIAERDLGERALRVGLANLRLRLQDLRVQQIELTLVHLHLRRRLRPCCFYPALVGLRPLQALQQPGRRGQEFFLAMHVVDRVDELVGSGRHGILRLHHLLLEHLALLSECGECCAGGIRLGLGLRRHGAVVVVDHLHDRVAGANRLVVAHKDSADIPGQMRAERRTRSAAT